MMNIETLIKNEIVKIIEDASYICVTSWADADRYHTTQKLQVMTNSFDTHLTILLRNYKGETIVSAYPWPTMEEDSNDKLPFHSDSLDDVLDEMKVYLVPADLDLRKWMGDSHRDSFDRKTKVSTAFFKIKYEYGITYRNCFESIRSVIIGNCLTKRAA